MKQHAPKKFKRLRKGKTEEHRHACQTFCNAYQILEENNCAAELLLLILLSLVADLSIKYGILDCLPIVNLGPLPHLPKVLNDFLNVVQGPDVLHGKHWILKRPWVIRPLSSDSDVSCKPVDYLGGNCKIHHYATYTRKSKKKKFYIPLFCATVAFSPGTPAQLQNDIVNISPLIIPVFCSKQKSQKSKKNRLFLDIEGECFNTYNQAMLDEFISNKDFIFFQISEFIHSLDTNTKISNWKNEVSRFRPFVQKGRFRQDITHPRAEIYSVALALFEQFLKFSCKKKRIDCDQAEQILNVYWNLVLPESAPGQTIKEPLEQWDKNPQIFWAFLEQYIQENISFLITSESKRTPEICGILHRFDKIITYLIFPRNRLLTSFVDWLNGNHIGVPAQQGTWETDMQKTLTNTLDINFKRTGDVTWRWKFYDRDSIPANESQSIPCLGIPLNDFPESIQAMLTQHFGSNFDRKHDPDTNI